MVLLLRWWQRAAEVACWIAFRSAGCDSIAEYLAAVLHGAVRRLLRTSALDAAQHGQ